MPVHRYVQGAGEDRSAQVDALCRRISAFRDLPQKWVAGGAIAPDARMIDFACKLLHELPRNVQLPQANPSADGDIGLSWFNGHNRLEAMLLSDGHLAWIKRIDGQDYSLGDEVEWRDRWPSAFVNEVVNLYR